MLGKAPSVLFRQSCAGWKPGANSFFQNVPVTDFAMARFYLCRFLFKVLGAPQACEPQFLLLLGPHLSGAVREIPVLCRLSPSLRCAEDTWWDLSLSSWGEPHPGHWHLRFFGVCLSEGGRAKGLVRTKEEEAQGKPNPAAPVSLLLGQVEHVLDEAPVLDSWLERRGWFFGLLLRVLLATTAGNIMGISTEDTLAMLFQNTGLSVLFKLNTKPAYWNRCFMYQPPWSAWQSIIVCQTVFFRTS